MPITLNVLRKYEQSIVYCCFVYQNGVDLLFQTRSRGSRSSKESTVTGSGSPPVLPFVVSSSSLTYLSSKTSSVKSRRRHHRGGSISDTVTHSRGSLEGLNQASARFLGRRFDLIKWVSNVHPSTKSFFSILRKFDSR